MSSRSSNLILNAALIVVLIVAAVLVYSFSQRIASPRPDPKRLDNPGALLGEFIQLEVQNGTGVDGLAAELSEYLGDLGFDVVEVGNYGSEVQETVIFDRIGNPDAAEQVALALGVDSSRIRAELEPTWFLDASIVIGQDYRRVMPFSERFPEEESDDSSDENEPSEGSEE